MTTGITAGASPHESQRLARWHASNPTGWCEKCAGTEPETEDDQED